MSFTFAEPTEWWLEVPPSVQTESWQRSQQHTTPGSRWNAYLNQICLKAVLAWMQAEYAPEANTWLDSATLPPVWEIVNGTAIAIGATRFVLVSTEAIDDGEMEVPQEWVDIPSWVADYYLSVQIQPEGEWVRVWGYATHQEIKALGRYDPSDRTYCINAEDLTKDLSTLWVTVQFYPDRQTRSEIVPLPALSTTQAENLIQRLGDASVVFPRLAVPFALWGSLIENEQWRRRLYQQRATGVSAETVRLSDWLWGRVAAIWQTLDAVLSPQQVEFAWRSRSETQLTNRLPSPLFDISRVKVLDFGLQPGSEQVGLLVGVSALNETDVTIGVQISPVGNRPYLPNPVQLRLLDETGEEVEQASAAISETIQLQFNGNRGEQFKVEVTCGDRSITENFVI